MLINAPFYWRVGLFIGEVCLGQGSATFNVKRAILAPFLQINLDHKIFNAQIKITRHIAKVLYSVMLQGRGVTIISEVRGAEMSNVVIIINMIVFMYV